MSTYVEWLILKYQSRGIIIDTNLLVLLLVGLYDKDYIQVFKRTASYSSEDFEIILKLIKYFRHIIVTPQILAELSNITEKMEEERLKQYFKYLVNFLSNASEKYVPKDLLLKAPFLYKIGFTDLSIVESSTNKNLLVLTDDLRLTNFLAAKKCDFINLNHIRTEIWFKK
jgi:hypothetical protein